LISTLIKSVAIYGNQEWQSRMAIKNGNQEWQARMAKIGNWFISGEVQYYENATAAIDWLDE
jgi:hypothetical protein